MTTNREWLESLDNEEFAGAIGVVGRDCETCPAARECGNARNGDDCAHSFAKWLEEEHPYILDEAELRYMNGQVVFIGDIGAYALVLVHEDKLYLFYIRDNDLSTIDYSDDIRKHRVWYVEFKNNSERKGNETL
jgi:hypothetical protein